MNYSLPDRFSVQGNEAKAEITISDAITENSITVSLLHQKPIIDALSLFCGEEVSVKSTFVPLVVEEEKPKKRGRKKKQDNAAELPLEVVRETSSPKQEKVDTEIKQEASEPEFSGDKFAEANALFSGFGNSEPDEHNDALEVIETDDENESFVFEDEAPSEEIVKEAEVSVGELSLKEEAPVKPKSVAKKAPKKVVSKQKDVPVAKVKEINAEVLARDLYTLKVYKEKIDITVDGKDIGTINIVDSKYTPYELILPNVDRHTKHKTQSAAEVALSIAVMDGKF